MTAPKTLAEAKARIEELEKEVKTLEHDRDAEGQSYDELESHFKLALAIIRDLTADGQNEMTIQDKSEADRRAQEFLAQHAPSAPTRHNTDTEPNTPRAVGTDAES